MIYCLNPYNPNKGRTDVPPVYFRCRQCRLCRIVRINEWKNRVFLEFGSFGNVGMFLTLTYNEDFVPENGSLVMSDLQKFVKRIRKNSGKKLKYFACGEYGDKFDRPHYHLIVLGLSASSEEDCRLVQKAWAFGFCYIGFVSPKSIGYVAQYLNKRFTSKDKELMFARYGGKHPEFQVQSRGMGFDYLKTSPNLDLENFTFTLFGKKIPLFRLAKEKFYLDPQDVYRAHQLRIKKGLSKDPTRDDVRQCAVNLAAKLSLQKNNGEIDYSEDISDFYKKIAKEVYRDSELVSMKEAYKKRALEMLVSRLKKE